MMKGTLDYLLRSTPTISLKITLAIVSLAISVFDTNMMVKCNVFFIIILRPPSDFRDTPPIYLHWDFRNLGEKYSLNW